MTDDSAATELDHCGRSSQHVFALRRCAEDPRSGGTDVNASATAGLSLNGKLWGRPQDRIGLAGLVNGISKSARAYFAGGGLGLLIGDGRLARYGTEDILETYYRAPLTRWLSAGIDYQFIANPAYNRDRGPVSVFGFQLHGQF